MRVLQGSAGQKIRGHGYLLVYMKTAKKSNPQPFFSPKSRKWRKKSIRRARGVVLSGLALSVTAFAVPPLPKGEARALPETSALHLKLQQCALDLGSPFGGAGAGAPERAFAPPQRIWKKLVKKC